MLMLVATSNQSALGQTGKPVVNAVGNVASYAIGTISPGEMVVIFGSGMGPTKSVTAQLDSQGRVATLLSQVQVLFDGTAAPLVYVSASQVAAMVPYELAGKATTQVQVAYQGVSSDPVQKTVVSAAPGIFTADSSGIGQAAMTNSDGSYNGGAHPAAPGTYVTFYLTGEGQTNPPGSDGTIATSTANVVLPVIVLIAGRTAQLLYAGSAPENVNGFAQVNVAIPADMQYGGNLPLSVQIGGISSQPGVTLAVSGPPAPIPGSPQNISASVNASGQIVLAWAPADSLAVRFHIERQAPGNAFAEIGIVQVAATTFTDPNVTAGTTYQYRIRAENDYGFSPYSAVATTTVPVAQVSPPANLQTAAVSQTQINLTWSNANTNATRFHIERKTGTGAYAETTVVPATATSFQDATVQPNTAYTYRARSEGTSGFSAYSNESSATTPALSPPPVPTLQAAATSASQVHLSWSSTATGVILFSIERRTTSGAYSQIGQPSPTSTTFDDPGLAPSTIYFYRMRVETSVGFSAYSNEVTAATFSALPGAPTNLQATAVSSNEMTLTWTNNALNATAIRVESAVGGSSTFTDIGAAATLTSTRITNLQPNTVYSFRVRALSAGGFSAYSNVTTATTLPIPKTVFLIHGIGQDHTAMAGLYGSLVGSSGIDMTRFRVDAGFDFSECASPPLLSLCPANCSIETGAQKLAQYIVNANPPGDIILVGFSMGGLIARDLMANNRIILNGRKISALVTLGTPNLGYPYTLVDTTAFCTNIVQEMDGNWRSQQVTNTVVLSTYLYSMTNLWPSASYPGSGGSWLAASGRSCSNPIRTVNTTTGCRDKNPYSDGVVCDDSATYFTSTASGTAPNLYWQDPSQIYVHSNYVWGIGTSFVLCGNSGNTTINPLLSNPPSFGPLFAAIKGLINGLH